ncbi:MAG TPA: NADH-quinone oxidoreductase subunit A [Ginsengibacter sp.]|nr:NADH-quinone oxidoreductase subunit A [Ginsengibacter sp.]HRP16631.1 NADH-quinone oxidoreductase subunit A [Ginsengibacter sp.]HRP43762.1 NADH-quinone oxidoreductase subunit A [Ginsengibacter sp.]
MQETESLSTLWPLLVYAGGVVLLVSIMLVVPYFLGETHKESTTGRPYESGIKVTGDARFRFPVHFYILAMLFVIFDLEVVFVVAWAIHAKALGWAGYIAISIFIGLLFAVLVYEWRMGALDFGPSGEKILKKYHEKFRNNPETILKGNVEN